MIGTLYSTDYESECEEEEEEKETPSDTSSSAPDRNLWAGKNGTFWSFSSSPKEGLELTMSFVQKYTLFNLQKYILLRMLFNIFSATTSLKNYCCIQTCKVDGPLHNGMLYKKRNS